MHLRRVVGLVGIACLCTLFASPRWRALGYMPSHVAVDTGDSVRLSSALPSALGVRLDAPGLGRVDVDGRPLHRSWAHLGRAADVTVRPLAAGRYAVAVGAFGVPLRRVEVDAVKAPMVLAGGQSIGIRVRTAGVLVVSRQVGGAWRWPLGGRAGLAPGDRIVAAEGRAVTGEEDLRRAVSAAGGRGGVVHLRVVRDGRSVALALPARPDAVGSYRLGVVVREGLSGIGTLTFVDPGTGMYAALGHRIQDGWSGQSVPVATGQVSAAPILGVRRGFIGRPGEKIGRLAEGSLWGDVEGSGPYGIFGRLRPSAVAGPILPLATADQVHVGRASILTVVAGQRVERFGVRIERVDPRAPGGRGLVVKVTDAALLARTGGIVQGMSGSPIIQDGRLAGALTHVLVSDNTRGYGIFAAWMWQEAKETVGAHAKHVRADRPSSTVRAG